MRATDFKTAEYRSEFSAFASMRKRCNNPNAVGYHLYGGRGIRVCEQWSHFANFMRDMGPKPSPTHSIDRIDPNGNYEPGNCRWATRDEQNRNRRSSLLVTIDGRTQCLKDWAAYYGVPYKTVHRRVTTLGWAPERALTFTGDGRTVRGAR